MGRSILDFSNILKSRQNSAVTPMYPALSQITPSHTPSPHFHYLVANPSHSHYHIEIIPFLLQMLQYPPPKDRVSILTFILSLHLKTYQQNFLDVIKHTQLVEEIVLKIILSVECLQLRGRFTKVFRKLIVTQSEYPYRNHSKSSDWHLLGLQKPVELGNFVYFSLDILLWGELMGSSSFLMRDLNPRYTFSLCCCCSPGDSFSPRPPAHPPPIHPQPLGPSRSKRKELFLGRPIIFIGKKGGMSLSQGQQAV